MLRVVIDAPRPCRVFLVVRSASGVRGLRIRHPRLEWRRAELERVRLVSLGHIDSGAPIVSVLVEVENHGIGGLGLFRLGPRRLHTLLVRSGSTKAAHPRTSVVTIYNGGDGHGLNVFGCTQPRSGRLTDVTLFGNGTLKTHPYAAWRQAYLLRGNVFTPLPGRHLRLWRLPRWMHFSGLALVDPLQNCASTLAR